MIATREQTKTDSDKEYIFLTEYKYNTRDGKYAKSQKRFRINGKTLCIDYGCTATHKVLQHE